MAFGLQVTFDASDPEGLGEFWAQVLDYHKQPPPEGFATWAEALIAFGVPEDEANSNAAYAITDPDGVGPRLFFQRVPEGKTAKNRMHLDVNVGAGLDGADRRARADAELERVLALGATLTTTLDDGREYCHVLRDIEGNEFCLQ